MITPIATVTATGGPTAPIDTTGATLLLVAVSWFAGGVPIVSDSFDNVWTPATPYTSTDVGQQFLFAVGAAILAGPGHTFAVDDADAAIIVHAFAGVEAVDVENGYASIGPVNDVIAPGAIEPSVADCLVVTGLCLRDKPTAPPVVVPSMTETHVGGSLANPDASTGYLVEPTPAILSIVWDWKKSTQVAANVIAFRPVVENGGGGGHLTPIEAVRRRLLSQPALTALVADRITTLLTQQSPISRSIRLQEISRGDYPHFRGAANLRPSRIQVDVFVHKGDGDAYAVAHAINDAVRGEFVGGIPTGLAGFVGVVGDVAITAVLAAGDREMFDPEDLQTVRILSEYFVFHKTAAFRHVHTRNVEPWQT